jgi:hypothetical protein
MAVIEPDKSPELDSSDPRGLRDYWWKQIQQEENGKIAMRLRNYSEREGCLQGIEEQAVFRDCYNRSQYKANCTITDDHLLFIQF